MDSKSVVKRVMEKENVDCGKLSSRININYKTLYDSLFTRCDGDMKTKRLSDLLRALDYKLIAVPRAKRLGDDEYEVN